MDVVVKYSMDTMYYIAEWPNTVTPLFMHTRGVFRSEQNSCMNNNIPYYSTISRESIVKRIKEYAGEEYSFEEFVANDSREVGTTTKTQSSPFPSTLVRGSHNHPVIMKGSPLK